MLRVTLAALLLGGMAQAECPTVTDLPTGVQFTIDDGDKETFRELWPGMVESVFEGADGTVYRNLLAKGIYLVEWADIVDGQPDLSTRSIYAFAMSTEDLPEPVPGRFANLGVLVNGVGSLDQEIQMYRFEAQTTIDIGACTYDMIPIELRFAPDSDRRVNILHYLPDLGLAYLAADRSESGSYSYSYTAVEALK